MIDPCFQSPAMIISSKRENVKYSVQKHRSALQQRNRLPRLGE